MTIEKRLNKENLKKNSEGLFTQQRLAKHYHPDLTQRKSLCASEVKWNRQENFQPENLLSCEVFLPPLPFRLHRNIFTAFKIFSFSVRVQTLKTSVGKAEVKKKNNL